VISEGKRAGVSRGVKETPTLAEALESLPEPARPLKPLAPAFIPPGLWRSGADRALLSSAAWRRTREGILERDGYRCVYCDHHQERGLEVNHISGNSRDDREHNLETVCVLCHRVLHAGRSAAIYGSLLLFERANVDQNTLQRLCWQFRRGPIRLPDRTLMSLLGLAEPRPFRMDADYLAGLRGYVVERYYLLEKRASGGS